MVDFATFIKENSNGMLATWNGSRITSRIVHNVFVEGNKAYFCTSSEKPVYKQLTEHKCATFCTHNAAYNEVLSISGEAIFVEDMAIKERILSENEGIKNIYKTADNPIFKVFYIDIENVDSFSFKEGPKKETV